MNKPVKQPFDASLIARVSSAWNALRGKRAAINPLNVPQIDDGDAFFGPQNPVQPIVSAQQQSSVVGRQFDFAPGYNLRQRPRAEESVSYHQMRALADNCDVLRLVIETRKDQIAKMQFAVRPIDNDKEPDARCAEVQSFLKSPDGESTWHTWLRAVLEEVFVTDAASIYPWLNNDGSPYRFELVDGATIKRVLNVRGRTPDLPLPAYQQVLKGVPAVDYTRDELIYMPRNRRVNKVYGFSPVEQIVQTVNIAIRRSLYQLQYYTEGSTPDLLFACPPEWQMSQIKEFSDYWQSQLSGQSSERRRVQMIPHGIAPINTKDQILKDDYDEWLARIICYAFSVPPTAFSKAVNRATAQTAQESSLQEGLQPLTLWIKSLMDKIIQQYFGYADLEFSWADERAVAPLDQNTIDDTNVKNGTATINEIRASRGDAPIEGGDVAMCWTTSGYVPIVPIVP